MSQYFDSYNSNCKLQNQRQKLSVAVIGQKRPKYFRIHTLKSDRIHVMFVSV